MLAFSFGGKEDYEQDLSDRKWFDAQDDEWCVAGALMWQDERVRLYEYC